MLTATKNSSRGMASLGSSFENGTVSQHETLNSSNYISRPNQSLKLTEPAVDDFAAREKLFKGKAISAARVFYMELAVRRRSLAPVR